MPTNLSLFSVTAVLILASDGSRVLAKYYNPPHSTTKSPYPTAKEQKVFEKGLHAKTVKTGGDVVLYDNHVVVYKAESDVIMYVVGGLDENELMLFNVALAMRDTLLLMLRNAVDKRTIAEHYDMVSLALEEMVDDGVILETDPQLILQRVTKLPQNDIPNIKDIDLSEKGLLNAWEFGKKHLAEKLRQGL
ncbi:Similar to Coatomer subunit zeta; acc. no. P53600 [Pyronema omphalodes CBS 100304]|uniref:Coatomer subunit zeta n=1 Tax=Pyronema omphalodes (strain CBS 100304) TaxID=1076935 RepID=U4L1L6_PYROM|nr:Similar to Coatomer subunit zeta; acc. no. P53600 [Pyronema omphalodes CBS 100304]